METKRPIDPGRRLIALAAVASLALVNYSAAQTVAPEKPVTARPKVVSVGAKMSTAPVDSSVKRTGGFHDSVASPQGPTEQAVLPVPTKPQPAPPAPVTPSGPGTTYVCTSIPANLPRLCADGGTCGPGRRVLLHAAASAGCARRPDGSCQRRRLQPTFSCPPALPRWPRHRSSPSPRRPSLRHPNQWLPPANRPTLRHPNQWPTLRWPTLQWRPNR